MGRDVHIYGTDELAKMTADKQQDLLQQRQFELDNMGSRTNSLVDIADALAHIAKYGIICYHVTTRCPDADAKTAYAVGRGIQLQNLINPLAFMNPPVPSDDK